MGKRSPKRPRHEHPNKREESPPCLHSAQLIPKKGEKLRKAYQSD